MPDRFLPIDKTTIVRYARTLRSIEMELVIHQAVIAELAREYNVPESEIAERFRRARSSAFVQTYIRERYDIPLQAFLDSVDREGIAKAVDAMLHAFMRRAS